MKDIKKEKKNIIHTQQQKLFKPTFNKKWVGKRWNLNYSLNKGG